MSNLRSRGQYSQATQEEFEYINSILSIIAQNIDEDGNLSMVRFIHRGTITVASGSSTGTADLPQAVDTARTDLSEVGQRGGTNPVDQRHTLALTSPTLVTATRNGTAGEAVVAFQVKEYF